MREDACAQLGASECTSAAEGPRVCVYLVAGVAGWSGLLGHDAVPCTGGHRSSPLPVDPLFASPARRTLAKRHMGASRCPLSAALHRLRGCPNFFGGFTPPGTTTPVSADAREVDTIRTQPRCARDSPSWRSRKSTAKAVSTSGTSLRKKRATAPVPPSS